MDPSRDGKFLTGCIRSGTYAKFCTDTFSFGGIHFVSNELFRFAIKIAS